MVIINPPERVDIRAIANGVRFAGPSALILPNGSLRCGSAADAVLSESRRDAMASSVPGGLLLVNSHRQRRAEFEQLARMLDIIYHMRAGSVRSHGIPPNQTASILTNLSLLIVNNNAVGQATNYASPEHPVSWLRRFNPTLRLRMLLLTAVNMGYSCGGMHVMAASSEMIALFPWVLCLSGPDSLPTPWGAFRLSAMLADTRLSRSGARAETHMLLADHFMSPSQLSNDLFVYLPPTRAPAPAAHLLWSSVTEQCLGLVAHYNNMPEPMLMQAAHRHRINVSFIGAQYACQGWSTGCFDWAKAHAKAPLRHAACWHSHNASLVGAWLAQQERGLGVEQWVDEHELAQTGHGMFAGKQGTAGAAPEAQAHPQACTLSSQEADVWCASRARGGLGRC